MCGEHPLEVKDSNEGFAEVVSVLLVIQADSCCGTRRSQSLRKERQVGGQV